MGSQTATPPKTGVMICGHGSRSQSAVDEFSVLADKLPAYLPDDWMMEYGYLEFANPVIRDGLDRLREAGCTRILAVPGMLFAAMHSKNDIPTVLNTYAEKHGIDVSYGRELGVDPKMIAAAGARITEAVAKANAAHGEVAFHDTCLVVIGRGASDPDANGNVAKIAHVARRHRVWLVRGRLFRRDFPIGRTLPDPCGETGLQTHHRLPLFPVYRHFDRPHLWLHRSGRRRASRHSIRQSRIPERPSSGSCHLCRTGDGANRRDARAKLWDLRIPHSSA